MGESEEDADIVQCVFLSYIERQLNFSLRECERTTIDTGKEAESVREKD